MPTTEYYARACEIESNLCPARRRRGKRALLLGTVRCRLGDRAVPSRVNGHCRRANPLSGDYGYELSTTPIACAVWQIWGLGGAVSVGGRAWPRLTAGLWPFYALSQ